jgi:hypothetical protein
MSKIPGSDLRSLSFHELLHQIEKLNNAGGRPGYVDVILGVAKRKSKLQHFKTQC